MGKETEMITLYLSERAGKGRTKTSLPQRVRLRRRTRPAQVTARGGRGGRRSRQVHSNNSTSTIDIKRFIDGSRRDVALANTVTYEQRDTDAPYNYY